ncbi:type 4a pilus biogenesis protein PilO [Vibrio fortis]
MVNFQDLDIDEITEWPLLPQMLVIVLLMLVIQGFGAWFYVMPLNDELDQMKQQEQTLKTTLRIKANKGLDNNLTFTRIDWGAKENKAFLYRLPLNIELTGDYHEIGDFSAAIAKLPRIISFDDVTWQRVSQESSTLHFRVRAYTYQFKAEVKDESR